MNVIELNSVSKSFQGKTIYSGVNLSVADGETIGIVGSNGSGKSVLFQLIAGLIEADSGSVSVWGKQTGGANDYPKDLGIFVNNPTYIDYRTGLDNLLLLAGIQGNVGEEDVRAAMASIGLDPDDPTPIKNYSSGMKQKLGIVQAVMENQKIVLLDEPFNALDHAANRDVAKIIRTLQEKKCTIVLTSHQHEYLEQFCDRMLLAQNHTLVPFTKEMQDEYFRLE